MSSTPARSATASQPSTGKSVPSAMPTAAVDEDSLRNVYIRNLDARVSAEELRQIFEPFGEVDAHKLMVDIKTGISRGFGFVMYRRAADAAAAVRGLDGFEVYGSKLQVRLADTKTRPPGEPTRRLFLRNLPPNYTQADVEALCGAYGVVVSCVVRRDERHAQVCSDGGLTLVAHVEMGAVEAAQTAVRSLNNCTMFCPHVPSALLAKVVDHSKQVASTTPASFDLSKLQTQHPFSQQALPAPSATSGVVVSTSASAAAALPPSAATLAERRRTSTTVQHPNYASPSASHPPPPPSSMPLTRVTVGNRSQMQMVSSGREQQLPSPATQFPTALPPPPLVLPSPQTPSLPPGQHGIIQFDSSFGGDSFAASGGGWYPQPSPSHQQQQQQQQQQQNATPTFMSGSLTTNPMQMHHSTPTNMPQPLPTAYVGPGGQILFFRHDDSPYALHGTDPMAASAGHYPGTPNASAYHPAPPPPHQHHHQHHHFVLGPDLSTMSYGAYSHHHHHHHHHAHH